MDQGYAVILPMLIFLGLDIVIVRDVLRCGGNSRTQRLFTYMSVAAAVQQLCGALIYIFDYKILSVPNALRYAVYAGMLTGLTFTAYVWFIYLRYLITDKHDITGIRMAAFFLPVALELIAACSTPWTHWLVWLDENGVYHGGSLYFVQFVCPYMYLIFVIVALVIFIKRGIACGKGRLFSSFIAFAIPSIVGSVLQVGVFRGGYTMIGMSCGVIMMYLGRYIEEVNALRQMKAVESLNAQLTQANAEQKAQLDEITLLNAELKENQEKLEAASARQAGQLKEITALNQSLAEYTSIMSDAGLGIWTFDLDYEGHICGMRGNDKFRSIYGILKPDMSPKECLEYFLNGLVNKADDPTQYDFSLFKPTDVVHFTFDWNHPLKGVIRLESTGTRHTAADGSVQVSGSIADITESERYRRQREQANA